MVVATPDAAKSAEVPKKTLSKFDKMRKKFGVPTANTEVSGFTYDDFEDAMGDHPSFNIDDVCIGKVYQLEPNGALVDIGAKASAYIPQNELCISAPNHVGDVLSPGEEREFQIISEEDMNGQLTLSMRKLEFSRAWERVAQLQAEDATVRASVIGVNRGGAIVEVENLRAFVPGSHMATTDGMDEQVGAEFTLKFLEVDPVKGRLVVSQRRAMVETQMNDLSPGMVVKGVVKGIKPYGAFVDIGGISGLLHISQISHDHIDDVGNVLRSGMEVKCMIINQDREKGRISLSTRTLEPEPGDMIKDPQVVFDKAEEMAERYQQRMEDERKAAADVADDIVSSLDMASLDDITGTSPAASTE